ncbi:hypothetical protein WU86_09505 [Corynebacterium xerosis]|nr:hypothetical protein WU86_09505 [Corynebacterium xerosis]
MVQLLLMVEFVLSVYVSVLKVLKHVMTKSTCLMYKWVMLLVGIKNLSFLNQAVMLLSQKHLFGQNLV